MVFQTDPFRRMSQECHGNTVFRIYTSTGAAKFAQSALKVLLLVYFLFYFFAKVNCVVLPARTAAAACPTRKGTGGATAGRTFPGNAARSTTAPTTA